MGGSTPELFSVKQSDDPAHDWSGLVKELEKFAPSMLDQWKKDYECWKHQYSKFRQFEQDLIFTGNDAGEPAQLNEQLMRFHRRALFALLSSGERCAELLQEIPLDHESQQERYLWSKRIRVLLDSLQESLDTWHRVNAERVEKKATG